MTKVMTLRELADTLRNPTLWPDDFVWDYGICRRCAMGLAVRLAYPDKYPQIKTNYAIIDRARAMFTQELPDYPDFYEIFYDLGGALRSLVTPDEVADAIDAYLDSRG